MLKCVACVWEKELEKGKLGFVVSLHAAILIATQGSKLSFFPGAQLHFQKLPKGVVYRNQYIFGLPAEI